MWLELSACQSNMLHNILSHVYQYVPKPFIPSITLILITCFLPLLSLEWKLLGMHLGKWQTASANLMNFLGWQFPFSGDLYLYLLNNWQCSLGPLTQKEGKYPKGSFFPTKYATASMSVFHRSNTHVHTYRTPDSISNIWHNLVKFSL